MKTADKQVIISDYLGSFEGISRLAEAMQAPLRNRRDYASMASSIFETRHELSHEYNKKHNLFPVSVLEVLMKACPFEVTPEITFNADPIHPKTQVVYGKYRVTVERLREDMEWFVEQDVSELPKHLDSFSGFEGFFAAAGLSGDITKEMIQNSLREWKL